MKEITKKYYMNAPCEVIRKISDDFSEVKVYPQFRDDLEGSQWCTECMVGNQGTPQRHTCDEYQEVIDALQDVENYILCIVENRLLADEPIEFKKIKALDNVIKVKEDIISNNSSTISVLNNKIDIQEKYLEELKGFIAKSEEIIENNKQEMEIYSNKILDLKKQYTITTPRNIDITKEEYEHLLKRDYILNKLEIGGVDNWEWYGESYPSDEELEDLI